MQDFHKALADIDAIRGQVARATQFRGYGPATVALTGVVALLAAGFQAVWLDNPAEQVSAYLAIWVSAAAISAVLIGAETITRSQRLHSALADDMIYAAIEQLIPPAVAGIASDRRAGLVCARECMDAAGPVADPVQPRRVCVVPVVAEAVVRRRRLVSGVRSRLSGDRSAAERFCRRGPWQSRSASDS